MNNVIGKSKLRDGQMYINSSQKNWSMPYSMAINTIKLDIRNKNLSEKLNHIEVLNYWDI